ncbi:putative ATP-grasp-modified RiPP [Streptomyces sp. NPDC002851]
MTTTELATPFGMRFLTPPEAPPFVPPASGGYSDALQISVTAEGNPWHALLDGDTKTETTPDGSGSGTDGDGTDLW